jgi:hypothetical protein
MTMSMTVTLDHDRSRGPDHDNNNDRPPQIPQICEVAIHAIREDAFQHKFRRYAKSLYARMLYSTSSADTRTR